MKLVKNLLRGSQTSIVVDANIPFPSVHAEKPADLLVHCPSHQATQLKQSGCLATETDIRSLFIKDESTRMGLGSFKALGAAYVIAHAAAETGSENMSAALKGQTYVTASAGNHGLSVAAGAAIFGANSIIFLSQTVPSAFADRLRDKGAEVRVEGDDYEASMQAAAQLAEDQGFILLSDSSWAGYYELPHRLMEGYLVAAKESVDQIPEIPSHIFLQAGVGGLAGAFAAFYREAWGDAPTITVVEPDAAPALQASIEAGKSVFADGPVSNMGRLDCKEPSLIALKGLARDADYFLTISDDLATQVLNRLGEEGMPSSQSGIAGIAALYTDDGLKKAMGLEDTSVVLSILSEGDD
ncbi:MAG: pyridoxal-phosphate dependent enzyme [Pseudomonadota bacterium]